MEKIISYGHERANSYKFLSEFYYLPDVNLIDMLKSLSELARELYSEFAGTFVGLDDIESLKIDYSKLFVGPYELLAPPYGSIYLENGKIMGDSTMDVRNRYSEEGLEITLKEVPDHIAIELEFMYFLISREIEAISDFDYERAIHYMEKQMDFLETHLSAWIPAFSEKVEKYAGTRFYKDLSCATKSFIKGDLETLQEFLSHDS